MKPRQYYLRERINPQIGRYWVRCGLLSKAAAKKQQNSLYGHNIMHSFATSAEYEQKIAELVANKEDVQ